MFADWENFYLIVGPSAGALIGLMFVVVTLTQGRDREAMEAGKHLYTSPIVWHLAVVMAMSAAAVAPPMTPQLFGILSGGLALLGVAMGIRSTVGIARAQLTGPKDSIFDTWWYGVMPTVAYVGLGGASIALLTGAEWSESAIGAALMALLLVSIHAEWDLVTFLAPMAKEAERKERKAKR